jgi:hypothetical protein
VSKARAALVQQAFGALRWDAAYQWWSAVHRRPSGEAVRVAVLNDTFGPRRRRVERAARLFLRVLEAEARVARQALGPEQVRYVNRALAQAGRPAMSADELAARLRLEFVAVYWTVPVQLTYAADDLVEGCKVAVRLDADLAVLRADVSAPGVECGD